MPGPPTRGRRQKEGGAEGCDDQAEATAQAEGGALPAREACLLRPIEPAAREAAWLAGILGRA